MAFQFFDSLDAIRGEMHVEITEVLKTGIHGVPDRFIVIDHEDSCFCRFGQSTIAVGWVG